MKKLPLAITAMLALTSCTPGGDGSPTPSPTPTSQSTTASPTTPSPSPTQSESPTPTAVESFPPAPSTESADQAAVREGWMKYWNARDKFLKDPSLTDLTEAKIVTVQDSPESRSIIDEIAKYRESDLKIAGTRVFRDMQISPPQQNGSVSSSTVSYCHDVSNVELLKISTGKSVPKGPRPTLVEQAVLERSSDNIWRVARITNNETSC